MADDVWTWCEKHGIYGHTVTVKVKFATFRQATRSKTVMTPITSQALLRDLSIALVRTVYPVEVGVSVSKLRSASETLPQLELGFAE